MNDFPEMENTQDIIEAQHTEAVSEEAGAVRDVENNSPAGEETPVQESVPAEDNSLDIAADNKADEGEPKKPFSEAYEWLSSLVYAVVAMLVLSLFVFRTITVDGESMTNTLQHQDKVLATNFFYKPDYGDIVVVQADRLQRRTTMLFGEPIIKRVIGLEGDVIRFDFEKGEVYRNGVLLEEDYIRFPTTLPETGTVSGVDYVVPAHCVYVMGDNRTNSRDSRDQALVGYVDTDLIIGKAFVRIFPFKEFKLL